MEKQRAMEILMEALCLSVPEDPAFVLKVHKDVLISRLRCAWFLLNNKNDQTVVLPCLAPDRSFRITCPQHDRNFY